MRARGLRHHPPHVLQGLLCTDPPPTCNRPLCQPPVCVQYILCAALCWVQTPTVCEHYLCENTHVQTFTCMRDPLCVDPVLQCSKHPLYADPHLPTNTYKEQTPSCAQMPTVCRH